MTRLTFDHYEAYDRRDIPGDHTDERRFQCRNCGEAPSFHGVDECKACLVALMLDDPTEMDALRRTHAGTQWLRDIEQEWERQLSAIVHLARACA